jgi:gas vesicle protein
MRRRKRKNLKSNLGKVVTGLLIGSVVGATIGWLTAPTTGEEMRRRISGEVKGVRAKARTAKGNVESRVHELIEEVSKDTVRKPVPRGKKVAVGG